MPASVPQTLKKEERIQSKKLIEKLFCGGSSLSLVAFPLRVVYLLQAKEEADATQWPAARMMISVPKRKMKRAVDRNRVKRQVREAYRKNKHILSEKIPEGQNAALAFLWLDDKQHESSEVESRVLNLLRRIGERL